MQLYPIKSISTDKRSIFTSLIASENLEISLLFYISCLYKFQLFYYSNDIDYKVLEIYKLI